MYLSKEFEELLINVSHLKEEQAHKCDISGSIDIVVQIGRVRLINQISRQILHCQSHRINNQQNKHQVFNYL